MGVVVTQRKGLTMVAVGVANTGTKDRCGYPIHV